MLRGFAALLSFPCALRIVDIMAKQYYFAMRNAT